MQHSVLRGKVAYIKQLRKVSYEDIAKEVGISYNYLREWMSGTRSDSQSVADKLEAWLKTQKK